MVLVFAGGRVFQKNRTRRLRQRGPPSEMSAAGPRSGFNSLFRSARRCSGRSYFKVVELWNRTRRYGDLRCFYRAGTVPQIGHLFCGAKNFFRSAIFWWPVSPALFDSAPGRVN